MVDECCPPNILSALREDNHDVVYVAEDAPSLSDPNILSRAFAEQRIIVTEDRDFCELVFLYKHQTFGIVLVRIHHTQRNEKALRLREVFAKRSTELPHSMTTVTLANVRIRPLSAKPDNDV